jgi:hypothetical protein
VWRRSCKDLKSIRREKTRRSEEWYWNGPYNTCDSAEIAEILKFKMRFIFFVGFVNAR